MTQRNDVGYYAEGRDVYKAPLKRKREDGSCSITIGFLVCEVAEWVGGNGAEVIADALNAARSPAPEGAETDPAAGARLAEIARIIEYVDNRCMAADGPVTKTRHEMTDDEMRAIYALAKEGPSATPQPDQSALLREARDALQAAQRFIGTEYEMIADDGELLAHEARPTYEQVTATLMKLREAMGDG